MKCRVILVMMKCVNAFSLIELMIVVAIIGILATIAVPAYNNYTIRARVVEALTAAAFAKATVTEYYQTRGFMPGSGSLAGISKSVELTTNVQPSTATNVTTMVDGSAGSTTKVLNGLWYQSGSGTNAIIYMWTNDAITGVGASDATTMSSIRLIGTGTTLGTVTWVCSVGAGLLTAVYLPSICR